MEGYIKGYSIYNAMEWIFFIEPITTLEIQFTQRLLVVPPPTLQRTEEKAFHSPHWVLQVGVGAKSSLQSGKQQGVTK